MNHAFKLPFIAAAVAAALALAGCGDEADPLTKEAATPAVKAAITLQELSGGACAGSRLIDYTAIDQAGNGRTQGYLILCANGTLSALGRDSAKAQSQVEAVAAKARDGITARCGAEGSDQIKAFNDGSSGGTTAITVRCRKTQRLSVFGL